METENLSERDMERAIYNKCGQCIWLNGEKSTVGIECTCPDKAWRHRTSKYHYKWTRACKMFSRIPQKVTVEIPMKLPSLNEYVRVCRTNAFMASKFKKDIEDEICWYLRDCPKYENPVVVHFLWIENNKRRDLDNVCFAKKFILDAMVKSGVLKDDNRKFVTAFTDTFDHDPKQAKVIVTIEEVLM